MPSLRNGHLVVPPIVNDAAKFGPPAERRLLPIDFLWRARVVSARREVVSNPPDLLPSRPIQSKSPRAICPWAFWLRSGTLGLLVAAEESLEDTGLLRSVLLRRRRSRPHGGSAALA